MHLSWIFWKETVWELIDCLITSRFGIFSIKKSKLLQFERACFAYILLYVCTSQMKFKTTFLINKTLLLKAFFCLIVFDYSFSLSTILIFMLGKCCVNFKQSTKIHTSCNLLFNSLFILHSFLELKFIFTHTCVCRRGRRTCIYVGTAVE